MDPVFPAPLGEKTPFLVESLGTSRRSVGNNGGASHFRFLDLYNCVCASVLVFRIEMWLLPLSSSFLDFFLHFHMNFITSLSILSNKQIKKNQATLILTLVGRALLLAAQTSQQNQVLQVPSADIVPLCRSSLIAFKDVSQFLTCKSFKNTFKLHLFIGHRTHSGAYVEVRRQLEKAGSHLPSCRSWWLNLSCQIWP